MQTRGKHVTLFPSSRSPCMTISWSNSDGDDLNVPSQNQWCDACSQSKFLFVEKTRTLSLGEEIVTSIFKRSPPSIVKNLPLRSGISDRVVATIGWICAAWRVLWIVRFIHFIDGNTPRLEEGTAWRWTASTEVVASLEFVALDLTFDIRSLALHLDGSGPWVWHDSWACESSTTDLRDSDKWIRPLHPLSRSPHLYRLE